MPVAPHCPVSVSQEYRSLFRGGGPSPPTNPSISFATDLASLLRTLNAIRDVLRGLSYSLTVNNLYLPRDPNFSKKGDRYYSQYPKWDELGIETSVGVVTGKKDPLSRAAVVRQDRVVYQNQTQNDPMFMWSYAKPIK